MSRLILSFISVLLIFSCNVLPNPESPDTPDIQEENEKPEVPKVDNPITLASPQPNEYIDKVSLSKEQKGYVDAGNVFALNCLNRLYIEEPGSMVYSPLSLMYALAMTVNGASGETATEIIKALGYGADVKALNEYCKLLLNQLPALDKEVKLSLVDAIVVSDSFSLLDSYQSAISNNYYAAVEYFKPSGAKVLVDRINEWAYRNTNGLIFPCVDDKDINDNTIAAIMNALYFKAPWMKYIGNPLFIPESTQKSQPFYLEGGKQTTADLMQARMSLPYAEKDDYLILSIPYSTGKFNMYVMLPKAKGKDGLKKLVNKLPSEDWLSLCSSLTTDAEVHLSLPKFTIESKYYLTNTMMAMGIKKAFSGVAEFNSMFNSPNTTFSISKIIQRAKISVEEWGTEAAAVTVVAVDGANKTNKPIVTFRADHPFVYVIAEKDSGIILFEGVFEGNEASGK